jgi:hypothetical protein
MSCVRFSRLAPRDNPAGSASHEQYAMAWFLLSLSADTAPAITGTVGLLLSLISFERIQWREYLD